MIKPWATVFFFMFLMISCATEKIVPEPLLQPGLPALSLTQLLALIENRQKAFTGFKGVVEVGFKIKKESGGQSVHKIDGVLYFEKSGPWRFQGFDLIGRTVVDLLITRGGFQIHLPFQGERFEGTLDQIPPIPLKSTHFLPQTLFPLVNTLGPLSLRPLEVPSLEKKKEAYYLHLHFFHGSQATLNRKVQYRGRGLDKTQVDLYDSAGNVELMIVYQDFRSVNGLRLPFQIKARMRDQELTLSFKEIQVNPIFDSKDFELYGGSRKKLP